MNVMFEPLQKVYSQLPTAERSVADFINKNPGKALFMSVKEMSQLVGVSEGTIIRMAQRCGFKGYSDFKLEFAFSQEKQRSIYESVKDGGELGNALKYLFDVHIQTLQRTLECLDISSMEKVVSKIINARKTEFYGVGSAGYVAQDAAHKFKRMDIPSWGYSDNHTQLAMASMMAEGCVAVGISNSGMTKETIEALIVAKSHGAFTVAITSNPHSPLANHANCVLKTSVEEPTFRSGSVAARLAQLAVIDAITVGIHLMRKDQTGLAFQNTSTAVLHRKIGGEDESIN
jgi:RpiR family transcriptional regulator, carbohydrate utilization regulator